MKKNFTHLLSLVVALTCAATTMAQNNNIPTTAEETNAIIAARGQLTDVPTVYIWMLDAQLNAKATKPQEYANGTDKNDTYYLIKTNSSSDYDTQISNNMIAANPNITDNAKLLPNYGHWEEKSDQYRLARIKVVDTSGGMKVRDELTTIRGRGNSTWYSDKKAYRLKFPSKTKLLAKGDNTNEYADAKNWTLLANASDKTMLRNALTREISMKVESNIGIKALPYYPAYKFVDVVLNNVYIGTYQISDHTQIQKSRINIDENNGWFLEGIASRDFQEDNYVTIGSGTTYDVNIKNPEDEFYTDEVKAAIKDYLDIVYGCTQQWGDGNVNNFTEADGFFKYADMESLISYFICNEISGNFDGLISNYAYRDINEGDKLMFGPLWDFDIAYNNYKSNDLSQAFIFKNGKQSPLQTCMQRIVENAPEFVNLLVERWNLAYDNGALTTYILDKVDEIAATMTKTRTLNYTPVADGGAGWDYTTDYLSWGLKTYSNYDAAIADLKSFITTHMAWLDTNIKALKTNLQMSEYTLDAEKQFNSWDNPDYFLGDAMGKIGDVQVANRTFKAGQWNTICLPFTLSKEDLQAKFGSDVQLLAYTSVTDDGTMNFSPAPGTRLMAGIPYLIKFSGSDVVNPKFTAVAISSKKGATVSYDTNPNYKFTGIYFKTAIANDGTVLLLSATDEAFLPNSSATTLTGLSAYITAPTGTTSVPITLNTTIENIEYDVKATGAMDLYADKTGAQANVTLVGRKTIWGGEWNAICLPFDASEETMTKVFGNFELKKFDNANINKVDETHIEFTFNDAGKTVTAGMPYLIKPEANVSDLTFENVVFAPTEAKSVDNFYGLFSFVGTLEPTMMQIDDYRHILVLGRNNKLLRLTSNGMLDGCRACLLVSTSVFSANATVTFNFDDGTDAITQHFVGDSEVGQDVVYNLSGQVLGKTIQQLPKGIYIVNGKKIIK